MDEPRTGRGGRSRGSRKPVATPRGRGRRTQADREAIAQAEAERNRARAEQYAKEQAEAEKQRSLARSRGVSRGVGRRGRGGFMGDQIKKEPRPSGPLSSGSVFSSQAQAGKIFPRPWGSKKKARSFGPNDSSSNEVKVEQRSSTVLDIDVYRENVEDGGYISTDLDEDNEGPRKNVNHIDVTSSDDEFSDAGHSNTPASKPIRVMRVPHSARASVINPEASSASVKALKNEDEEKLKDSDARMEDVSPIDESNIKVKTKTNASADDGLEVWEGAHSATTDLPEENVVMADFGADREEPSLVSHRKAGDKPEFLLKEDREEDVRKQENLKLLLAELSNVNISANREEERSEKDNENEQKARDAREGRVYILQFPPKLPRFNDPIKKELSPSRAAEPGPTPFEAQLAATENAQATETTVIKVEEDVEVVGVSPFPPMPANNILQPVPGMVGKLKVRKSGKTTLQWGDTSFVVNLGTEPDFLSEMMLVNLGDEQSTAGSGAGQTGDAVVLDQVRGRFVVAPNWDEILKNEGA